MTWFDRVRDVDLLQACEEIRLEVRGDRGGPCPACGAERRSESDRRGPVSIDLGRRVWRCMACEAAGGALELVTFQLHRSGWRELSESGKADVRAWIAARFGIHDDRPGPRGDARPTPVAPPPARPRPPQRFADPPRRPPAAEVAALWAACGPVTLDAEVSRWLGRDRGIDPERVWMWDLARALPTDAPLPRWAALGKEGKPDTARTWAELGYRAVVPLWSATGQLESLRARSVTGAELKAVPPSGRHFADPVVYQVRGLVMANLRARSLLRTGEAPPSWPARQALEVWIAEGEPDHLALATHWPEDDPAHPVVFGIESGAWTPEVAARIPNGARVTVATHHDAAGDRYFATIRETLERRCELYRHRLRRREVAVA